MSKDQDSQGVKEVEPIQEKIRQRLGYAAKQFVECSIAFTMKKDVQTYERSNGKATLSLTAVSKKHALPSGKDRLLFYWIRTQTTMNKSRVIDFKGVNATLEDMGMQPNSDNIQWLKSSILRAHNTLIYYTRGDLMKGGSSQGELIISKIHGLNFEEKGKHQTGKLEVSAHFYDDASIPIDLNLVKKLGRSWIALDLYTFIRKRLHGNNSNADIHIRLEDLRDQFGFAAGVKTKHLKERINNAVKILKKVGFEAIPYFDENGTFVIPHVRLPNVLTLEAQLAFEELDARSQCLLVIPTTR